MNAKITLNVNGKEKTVTTDPQRSLLDVLREDLKVTGPKYGCGEGRCGACTVLFEGQAVRSCLMLAVQANGANVTTVEGLADSGRGAELRAAFEARNAISNGAHHG